MFVPIRLPGPPESNRVLGMLLYLIELVKLLPISRCVQSALEEER